MRAVPPDGWKEVSKAKFEEAMAKVYNKCAWESCTLASYAYLDGEAYAIIKWLPNTTKYLLRKESTE